MAIYDNLGGSEQNKNIADKSTFSYTEEEIGTWINGKTLYRKTIDFGALPNTTIKSVAHKVSGYSEIWVDVSHSYVIATENRYFPINYPSSSGNAYAWECYTKGDYVEMKTNANRNSFSAIVTILYTK